MREDITNTIEYHKGASDSFPGQGGSQQGFGPSKLGAQNCLCQQEAEAVVQQISAAFVAPYSLLIFASSLENLVVTAFLEKLFLEKKPLQKPEDTEAHMQIWSSHGMIPPWEIVQSNEQRFRTKLNVLPTRFPHSIQQLLRIDKVIAALVSQPVVLQELAYVLEVDREVFKAKSHGGAVQSGKTWIDLGNWRYAVMFQLMVRKAPCLPESEASALLLRLSSRYPTLHANASYTYAAVSMQGDVMECILSTCRLKGDAVEAHVKLDRQQAHDHIKEVGEWLNRLLHYVADGERVRVASLPSPSFFIDTLNAAFAWDLGAFGQGFLQTGEGRKDYEVDHAKDLCHIPERWSHYEVLGVAEGATLAEIRRAYLLRSREHHPDKHSLRPSAKENFQRVQAAYEAVCKACKASEKQIQKELARQRAAEEAQNAGLRRRRPVSPSIHYCGQGGDLVRHIE
jgi:hypothetical protein